MGYSNGLTEVLKTQRVSEGGKYETTARLLYLCGILTRSKILLSMCFVSETVTKSLTNTFKTG